MPQGSSWGWRVALQEPSRSEPAGWPHNVPEQTRAGGDTRELSLALSQGASGSAHP